MNIAKCVLFFILLHLCGLSPAFSQPVTLNISNLNSSNGLSQNSILCILKDRYGFMWFGTQDGLNKYDGFKFVVYKHISNNPNTLPANLVTSLCEDAAGNLWVGTRLGGLSRYNRDRDSFNSYSHINTDSRSLSDNSVNTIYQDTKLNLWVGTVGGLNLFDQKTGTFKHFLNDKLNPQSISDSFVNTIYEDSMHTFWVSTYKGLNILNRETGNFTRYLYNKTGKYNPNHNIDAITEDGLGNLWVATAKGLNLLNRADHSFSFYPVDPDKNSETGLNPVYCMIKSRGNRLWIGSTTTLQLFDVATKQMVPLKDGTEGSGLLPNDGVYALLEDNEGILWIGTTSVGVSKYDRNLSVFSSYKASLTNTPSAKNLVRDIAEDKKGNLYLATDAGVEYYDRVAGTYKSYKHNAGTNSLSSNYTSVILLNKKNDKLWIGTYSNGLDCLDIKTGIFKHFTLGPSPAHINSNTIYALLEDSKRNIWIATAYGGVNVYNPNTETFTAYLPKANDTSSIADDVVEALYQDKKGNIWVGGYSHGISVFNPTTKKFTRINSGNSKLNSDIVSVFYEDSNDNMWVGTMEGGLNKYNEYSRKFKAYTEQNGLINNTINYITNDKKGNLWLSTLQGVTCFDPQKETYKNYSYPNGLKTLEFNYNSGAKLKSGEIALGNINGFNIIDPEHLAFNNNKPGVAITGLELFNKQVYVKDKNSPLKQSIITTTQINLNHAQSVFTIEYAALDYTVPEHNKYAYKLDGFDDEWRYVGNQRKATYTNLNPGTYTFMVKASNNDGVWNEQPTVFKITIIPAYWMTWWFRTLLVLLVLGLVYSIYLYRINFLRKQKIELETQVKARTLEIAAQANNLKALIGELQSQKEEMQTQSEALQAQSLELRAQQVELQDKSTSLELLNQQLNIQKDQEANARIVAEKARAEADRANLTKSVFLATMSHEIRTPMNGVLGMASLLSETSLDNEQREYTEAIVTSGESLLVVINDILDFSKIESGNLELDPHYFNLKKCVESVINLFMARAIDVGIKLRYQIKNEVPAHIIADGVRVRQVLTNLIGNAVKFTQVGEVFITVAAENVSTDDLNLYFEIQDTGIGIREDQLGNLFQAFNQIDSSVSRKYGGTGLGLVICERLVKLMGGRITVKSRYGQGSTFAFNISCKRVPHSPQPVLQGNASGGKNALEIDGNNRFFNGSSFAPEPKKKLLSEGFALNYPFCILVAEDNPMNQKLIMRVLNRLGYEPDLANDGREVLDMMKFNNYDLILMDMQMPNIDGLEATRIIRQAYGTRPLISAMTANALSEDKENCLNAGMDDYMSKPLAIEVLMTSLTRLYKKLHPQQLGDQLMGDS